MPVRPVVEGMDFVDPDGSLRRFADLGKGEAILVRPDGHVSAIVSLSQADTLADMLPSLLKTALWEKAVA